MARKVSTSASGNIATLLDTLHSLGVRDMTQALRELERAHGTYPRFTCEDAERIFQKCKYHVLHSNKPSLRYNALRFLKYVVTTEDFLRERAEDVWMLYKKTIFDEDGNIRNAGCQLLSRYRFGMMLIAEPISWRRKTRSKKKMEEMNRFQKIAVEQCIELFSIEKIYREKQADRDESREESLCGIVPGSWETKDKYLKTIRRGMEEMTRHVHLEDLAKKHGYELPRHWLFEKQISEENSEIPHADEDVFGTLIHPGKSESVMVSAPPDPKSFPTFEEYKDALALRETFFDHVQAVDRIMSSEKSEEEIDSAMEALGYQKHDDAPCHRPWCIERYGCVAMSLMYTLQDIEQFHVESFTADQRLLSLHEIEECEHRDCHALPQEWFTEGSRLHIAFRWFMDLTWGLEWNERKVPFLSFANDPLTSAFVLEAYWFTLSLLRKRPWPQEREGVMLIEQFLADNNLLRKEDALGLRKTFMLLCGKTFTEETQRKQ